MSFLSTVGKDIKSVFTWLGSSKGQAVIIAGENIASSINPGLNGIFPVINGWIQKAITIETIAAQAGQQDGSGAQKAAAVITDVTPLVQQYFPGTTTDKIAAINASIVAILNALGPAVVPPVPPQVAPK